MQPQLIFATAVPQNNGWYKILCTFHFMGGVRTFDALTNKSIEGIYTSHFGQERYNKLHDLVEPYLWQRLQKFIEFELLID